jgi:adenylate cyclase
VKARFATRIFLALGGLVCLALGVALGVFEPLLRGRAERDFAARFPRAERAFVELEALRTRALAEQIALVASHNAQLRTVLSTATLGDDLGFGLPAGAEDALRDANLRLRSLVPLLPLAGRAGPAVILSGSGQLLWSRADPERFGDDLAKLPLFARTLADGAATGAWTAGANAPGAPRLVPDGEDAVVYRVAAAPVVFEGGIHGVVIVGSALDAAALASVRAVSGLELALVARGALVASTLPAAGAEALAALPAPALAAGSLALAGARYRARLAPVSPDLALRDGAFLLLAPVAEEEAFVRRLRASLLAVGGAVLAAALVSAFFLARGITQPVAALASAARRVGAGALDTEVTPRTRDEVGELALAFNEMTRGLRERDRIRRTFERYVSPTVASEVLRHPELAPLAGVRRELTVGFVDVAGFTSLAERLAPDALVRRLNEYLDAVCGAVLVEDGTVNEFLGDGVVAFWGAPIAQPDHALRAARAALACRAALRALAERWRGEGLAAPGFRIGLHTGALIVGEIGAAERRAYRAVGDAMNVAARIEGANKAYGTELLVSETTRAAAGEVLAAREVDRVRVVGRAEPLALYEPAGLADALPPELRALHERYAEALTLFRAGDFTAAAAAFEACLVLAPGDGPSRVLLARANAFARERPASDWNGVHDLERK